MTSADGRQLLLVMVGTDHYSFDRLIRWVDAWLGLGRAGVRCRMQTGTSTPPTGPAAWQPYLEFDALQAAMGRRRWSSATAGRGPSASPGQRGPSR